MQDDFAHVHQKTILITGCSSGIGLHCALALHERGYRVFATVRQTKDVKKLADLGLESLVLDLADSNSIHNAVDEILQRSNGQLDALFNNGAHGQPGAVEDLSRLALQEQFETNVFGWQELTNALIPTFRQQGFGRIIHNSSVLGFVAMPMRGAYSASKHAIEALTDAQRVEMYDTKIYFSLIEPGPISSRFRHNAYKHYEKHIKGKPSPHQATYEEMEKRLNKEGAAVPFTLTPEAVLKPLIHALESNRPKIRYYVTVPTYLFAYFRHVLPYSWMDWIMRKIPK
jgi:NAD(P)-dependent dehydrogenase (short-subunit alcohol dehydrogenase family)